MLPNDLHGKTVLVAGAAGFVPSTLAEHYLKLGAHVIGLDNFITGSYSNIELLSKYENFKFYEENIYEELPDFKNQSIDYIFSMASPASPIDFHIIPLEIMRVNAEGTRKLLDLALEKSARFLEASTSEVYGDPLVHPQVEGYFGNVNPIGGRACYDESKRYAEALTMSYHRKYKVDTRIVRIFNTYGPRMRPNDGRVIPNFINQALKGDDITVYGDGTQTRSFCFVSDLIQAIHRVMFLGDEQPYNCGNPDEYQIKICAEYIVRVLESSSKIVYSEQPFEDDPKMRCPNIERLQSISDFTPHVSFEKGLKETAQYFKSLL